MSSFPGNVKEESQLLGQFHGGSWGFEVRSLHIDAQCAAASRRYHSSRVRLAGDVSDPPGHADRLDAVSSYVRNVRDPPALHVGKGNRTETVLVLLVDMVRR